MLKCSQHVDGINAEETRDYAPQTTMQSSQQTRKLIKFELLNICYSTWAGQGSSLSKLFMIPLSDRCHWRVIELTAAIFCDATKA